MMTPPANSARSAFTAAAGVVVACAALLVAASPASAQFHDVLSFEQEPIDYHKGPLTDPVQRLRERIDKGEIKFKATDSHSFLEATLRELDVDRSSQMLVFSKTSFQFRRIAPHTPRAVYFGDDVYVGWVQGSDVIELTAVDPKQGAIFYTLKPDPQGRPVFKRESQCLTCHASSRTQGVPGHVVRSIFPDADGRPASGSSTYTTDHRSPVSERWGGWYVTGKHRDHRHMGNALVTDPNKPEQLDTEAGANVTDLSDFFDTKPYLTPHSDIVALMVMEHQLHMHNLLTRANFETRLTVHRQKALAEALGRPVGELSESAQRRLSRVADEVVRYMLMIDETDLRGPIEGTSGFAKHFEQRGPFDSKGRSLRQLNLRRWLFRYPCSYLIYDPAFDRLPKPMLDLVYRKLWEVLTGASADPTYNMISTTDREAVLEILRETKMNLPAYWRAE